MHRLRHGRDPGTSDGGATWRTQVSDAGGHWRRQRSTTQRRLTGLCVVSGTQAYAVGDGGTILARKLTAPPHAARLAPTSGKPGKTLTIYGWGFGSSRGTSYVTIGTKTVTDYVLWSNMRIKVKVPAMSAGRKKVTVKVGSKTSNARSFRVK